MPPLIKIMGERNTGTNYVAKLVALNLEGELAGTFPRVLTRLHLNPEWLRDAYFSLTFSDNLGWKHAMAPSREILERYGSGNVVFLTLTKNPYSWLLSMFKRPYHSARRFATFEEFLRAPWPSVRRERYAKSFDNPMDMWNRKNASYLQLMSYAKGIALRYEDFLADPEGVIVSIQKKLALRRRSDKFLNVEQAAKKRDARLDFSYYRDYYLGEGWRSSLTQEQIRLINQHLDTDLMNSFGYKKL